MITLERPLYIFDLDGTIALVEHRLHLLNNKDTSRPMKFYDACDMDLPNYPVLSILRSLVLTGAEIRFMTGRGEEVRGKTIDWLTKYLPRPIEFKLQMRPIDDDTQDDDLKLGWIRSMSPEDRKRIIAVFEDRDRVVQMWRDEGFTCLQVAPGDF